MKTRVILMMLVAAAISFAQPAMRQTEDGENPRARFGRQSERRGFEMRMDKTQCGREQCTGCFCPFAAKSRGADFDSERNPEFDRKMAFMRWNAFRRLREADMEKGGKDFAEDWQSRRAQWGENRRSERTEEGMRDTDDIRRKYRGKRDGIDANSPVDGEKYQRQSREGKRFSPDAGETRQGRRGSEADKGERTPGDQINRRKATGEAQSKAGGEGLELRLKLRGAIMEKDYDQAKRIIDKLVEIDE